MKLGGHSHSTYTRRGGGGVRVQRGRGVLLGQVRTHAKKNSCTFSSLLNKMKQFEQPQVSDITQCDEEKEFHHFNKSPDVIYLRGRNFGGKKIWWKQNLAELAGI